jgi:hypothetical protein
MTDPMPERRRQPRQRSLLRGKLFFNNRLNVVDCTIRDMSDLGARVVHSEAVAIPDDLELYIPQKDQTFNVRVVWRRGQEAGVAFQAGAESNSTLDPNEIAQRFARLEAEVAGLKRIIKKLKTDAGLDIDVA